MAKSRRNLGEIWAPSATSSRKVCTRPVQHSSPAAVRGAGACTTALQEGLSRVRCRGRNVCDRRSLCLHEWHLSLLPAALLTAASSVREAAATGSGPTEVHPRIGSAQTRLDKRHDAQNRDMAEVSAMSQLSVTSRRAGEGE